MNSVEALNLSFLFFVAAKWDHKPWADSRCLSNLMERLAAIVPRPKIHLIRFAGVFAPHYKYRSEVVPKPKELSVVEELIESKTKPKSKSRISWARLLKRVFNIDVAKCNKCRGQMKIIAAISGQNGTIFTLKKIWPRNGHAIFKTPNPNSYVVDFLKKIGCGRGI